MKQRPVIDVSNNPLALEMVRNELSLMRTDILKTLVDPKRDIDYECGYPKEIRLEHYRQIWQRDGIGTRLINIWPNECWRAGMPEVIEGEEADDSDFEKEWKRLVKSQRLLNHLLVADQISGVGQYGIILLGLDDGKELSQPVEGVTGIPIEWGRAKPPKQERRLIFLRPFSQSNVSIKAIERNPKNPRFGQPTLYQISWQDTNLGNAEQLDQASARDVHWSRVIHLADNRISSPTWGVPRLQRVFNNLYNMQKVLGGSGEMFWKGGFPGFSFEINPDIKGDVEFDAEVFRKQLDAWSNGLQRYLTLFNMQAKTLSASIADPSPHLTAQIQAICISEGIPMRVFMGTEEGRMAGSQDERAWADRVKFRQTNYVTPFVVDPLVDRLLECGVLPWIDTEDGYTTKWPDVSAPSDADKADVAVKETTALSGYVSGGVESVIPPEQYMIQVLKWPQDKVEAIMKESEKFMNSSTMDRMQELKGNFPPPDLGGFGEEGGSFPPAKGQKPVKPKEKAVPGKPTATQTGRTYKAKAPTKQRMK